jgi:prepilin signal peptidase PulO-like enzyme (type II secretory pathway)
MELRLAALAIVGAFAGCLVNAAIDAWAWQPRRISPWLRRSESTPHRTWLDRLPVVGWWRLRRESALHGGGFWIRPLLIELGYGFGLAALYWFEVVRLGLIVPPLPGAALPIDPVSISSVTHAQFVNHALLAALMLIASFIDIDERIIPDEVTVLGTLLGLLLATILPMGFLPQVTERLAPPAIGAEALQPGGGPIAGPNGGALFVEPVHAAAPNAWPAALNHRTATALCVGLACFWLWCFAFTRRVWRGRHGLLRAVQLIAARVMRDLTTGLPFVIWLVGTLSIVVVWYFGDAAWIGLLTALIGLVVSGGVVWIIRIVGAATLRREAMGFGDVTLMMMVGTFLGWQACLVTFFLAPFAALVIGLVQLILRRDDAVPYGPFLCLAASAVILAWLTIWDRSLLVFSMPLLLAAVLLVCFILLGVMLYVWQMSKPMVGRTVSVVSRKIRQMLSRFRGR